MTEKELKHLSRAELLEMLLAQAEENRKLKKQLQAAQDALSDRRIAISQAGSLAEAALDRKSTRLNSSHSHASRMPSSA